MTSPIQPKPEATNDKYNDIHSVGSSFGQDLKNEAQVRQLLMGEDNGGAVFARAVRNFTQNVAGFVTELFSPEGASYHVITGAVTEQLGPINNAITASGERHLELAAEVDERISEQDRIIERSNTLLDENVAAIDALERENAGITERVTKAVNDADAAMQRADGLNTQISTAISKADGALSKADGAISDLAAYKKSVQSELTTLGTKVATNLSKAEQGIKDAKTASDAIKSLNTSLNSKIEEQIKASDYLEGELAKADSSVTAVSDLVRTQNPWKWTEDWQVGKSIAKTDTQMSMSAGGATASYANRAFTTNAVRLIPGHTYRIRAQGTGDGRVQLGFYRTKSGKFSSGVWKSGHTKAFSGEFDHYVDWVVDYPNEGEDGAQGAMFLHPDSDITVTNVTVQDISDLALVQPQINEGFSMALKAHQTLFEGQQNWNTTQEAINRFNSTKWATQTGVDAAQSAAVKANTDAIAASYDAIRALGRVDLGGNIVPYLDLEDSEIGKESKQYKPVWAFGTNKEFPAGDRLGDCPDGSRSWGVSSDVGRITFPKIPVKVNRNQQYKVRFWAKAHADSFISIRLYNQHGNHAIKSGSLCTEADGTLTRNRRNEIAYKLKITPTWTEYETVIEFDEIVDSVYIPHVEWNTPGLDKSTPTSWQALANLRIYPDIPTQTKVDEAQNNAIQAIRDAQRLQAALDLEKREVDKAQNDALKALGKVDLAGSLIAYADLTDEDLKKGITQEYRPQWASKMQYSEGYNNPNTGNMYYRWDGGAIYYSSNAERKYIKVDPNLEYDVSVWVSAAKENTKWGVGFWDQDDQYCVAEHIEYSEDADGKSVRKVISTSSTVIPTHTLKVGFVKHERIIKFKPTTREVFLRAIWFNNGAAEADRGRQYMSDFEIRPRIPSQAQIDRQQNELIQQGVKFDEQQKAINRTTQEQIWNHQDMIELLDIRTPKAAGWLESMSGQSHTYPSYGSTKSNGSPVVPSHPTTNYLYDDSSPFYCVASNMNNMHYVICKGKWVGSFTISVNWDSGVIDEWVMPVTKTNRVFSFIGGASHINMRSTRVELQVTSLARKAVYSSTGSTWGKTDDGDNFARAVNHGEDNLLRMRNTCKCDKAVYYLNAEGKSTAIAAGKVISGVALPARLNTAGAYTFTEVTDEDFSYSFDKSSPQKGQYETITNRSK